MDVEYDGSAEHKKYANPGMLVSTEWVEQHLDRTKTCCCTTPVTCREP